MLRRAASQVQAGAEMVYEWDEEDMQRPLATGETLGDRVRRYGLLIGRRAPGEVWMDARARRQGPAKAEIAARFEAAPMVDG